MIFHVWGEVEIVFTEWLNGFFAAFVDHPDGGAFNIKLSRLALVCSEKVNPVLGCCSTLSLSLSYVPVWPVLVVYHKNYQKAVLPYVSSFTYEMKAIFLVAWIVYIQVL